MALRTMAAVSCLFLLGCSGAGKTNGPERHTQAPSTFTPPVAATESAKAAPSTTARAPSAPVSTAELVPPGKPPNRSPPDLFVSLAERERDYLPNNYVSSETSQLQVAPLLLERHRRGGAYIGVGAEQNYSYIALVEPEVAFIIDPRRSIVMLHLLYKAMFDEARTRSEFVSYMVGRPYDASDEPPGNAGVADVIAHVEDLGRFAELRKTTLARLTDRITTKYGFKLTAKDRATLAEINQAFYDHGFDIRFEQTSGVDPGYVKFRDQLALRAPNRQELGFLARDRSFRYVQRMHRENRIFVLTGDLAGDKALSGIAAYLRAEQIPLRTFYLSNLEEPLFAQKAWKKWVKNLEALPTDEEAVFIRSWFGGERHPQQIPGLRTTTLLQKIADFRAREKQGSGWLSYQALVFDGSHETVTSSRIAPSQ
jgi:hypothetical protein